MKPSTPPVGRLLRTLREEKTWTLHQVSVCSGIWSETLLELEEDLVDITILDLAQLCRCYQLSLSEFFHRLENHF